MKKRNKKFDAYKLMIGGLKGGHSGMDINTGRANAIKMLVKLLSRFNVEYQIADLTGGSKRNAIPREAEVVVLFDKTDESKIKSVIDLFTEDFP